MFQVGDKVLYPMHGAGVIEAIEEKEVLGKNRPYYILNIPHIKMKIMIPIEKAEKLRVRQVVDLPILQNVLDAFYNGKTDPLSTDDQRYRREMNKTKIKSGDIYQGTEIIRDLMRKSKLKKLGSEDKAMLQTARQIFTSELIQVKGIGQEQAIELLDEVINI